MIFHFDVATWLRMLRLARRENDAATRKRLVLTVLVFQPLWAAFNAIFFALDRIVYPSLKRVAVRTPVFMVGQARSGTTLLHRLLDMDPGRYSVLRLYEMSFPSLIQKKAIRALGRFDARYLGGRIDRAVTGWEERKFAATQDMHRTGLRVPEEDDFVLASSCASGFWIVQFPYMGDLDFYYVDEWSARKRRRLMQHYKECVKRQLYLNGQDKVHLSKNPVFSGRVEALIETFPDARIIVNLRNPNETIPSLLKLLQTSWRMRGWTDERMQRSLRILADQSFHTYTHPLEVLEGHPDTPQAVVDYRELVASPKRTVEDVYAKLGFEVSPAFDEILEREEQRARRHETAHRYSLEEFGLKSDEIETALAPLFERYRWEEATT